MLQITDDHNSK